MLIKENRVKKIENRQGKREISAVNGLVFLLVFLCSCFSSYAQCAMCRASLESEGNTMKAEAVNDGIVYLMVIPYVLVGIVGIVVYRMITKKKLEKS
ncbi:hypothetical protein [Flavobacterium sp.]|uniref:hypothetical protein n=1 Tax=Flavobacterium sp. TaxID=239 RepID=UPI00260FE569|nr:hypothetical protein [Flavobacterium sp.]